MNQIADQGKDPKTDRKEDLEAQPRAKPFEIYDTRLHGSRCACSLPVCAVLYLIFNEEYANSSGTELQRVDLSSEAIPLSNAGYAGSCRPACRKRTIYSARPRVSPLLDLFDQVSFRSSVSFASARAGKCHDELPVF